MMQETTTHDWEHVKRVFILASMIGENEEADLEIIQLGALLHDIGRVVGEPHNLTGKSKAREILNSLSYGDNEIERIEKIVEYHNFSSWSKLCTIEEKIVWDADKLDGLGAIGVARAFFMRGETGLLFHDFSWFEEDTKLRFSRLNTKTARDIAKSRIEFMDAFFKQLYSEIL